MTADSIPPTDGLLHSYILVACTYLVPEVSDQDLTARLKEHLDAFGCHVLD